MSDNLPREDQVIRIAGSSFIFSRFFNDPFLGKTKKQNIYVEWVKNAFNKKGRYFIFLFSIVTYCKQ